MSTNLDYVVNRLSLRPPQAESLKILADIFGDLSLKKNAELETEKEKLIGRYLGFKDFERNFPCVCFALATGVGKTRLMGSFIAWLYTEKQIRNFLVLAPNLTIYNKLIDDFSKSSSPKYVFPGIGEFATNRPLVVTGDNYNQTLTEGQLFQESVKINIFNISKMNVETRGGKSPRIKRLSEYIGQSYFDYLSSLEDLVLLMDESHHYRAERGMQVINELNPVLGIEVTATPFTESNNGQKPFNNIVYQYSLAHAMKDGFVKEPSVATRKDFDPSKYNDLELDLIKLKDAIRIHQETKVALELYAKDNNERVVKPFVLVVTKDTTHAGEIRDQIKSGDFFNGHYADKTLEIHSNQRGAEKEENIQQLVSLEQEFNKTEIVIHVNMLKEGWDVTNLYTIVPLRTATSMTLREQTIGRGLRLPYGRRVGDPKVDNLTIIAHDKFKELVDAANHPDSIIKKENIVEIIPEQFEGAKEVIISKSVLESKFETERDKILQSPESEKRTDQLKSLAIRQTVAQVIQTTSHYSSTPDLKDPQTRDNFVEKVVEAISLGSNKNLFEETPQTLIADTVANLYSKVFEEVTEGAIEIPRIAIQPTEDVSCGYEDFELNLAPFNLEPECIDIVKRSLVTGQSTIQSYADKWHDSNVDLPNLILGQLVDFPQIDYDSQAKLLHKLAKQVIDHLRACHSEDDTIKIIKEQARSIADEIYSQMKPHFYLNDKSFEKPEVKPFKSIYPHNLAKITEDAVHNLSETISPTSDIPKKVFTGFKKACHNLYKFDGKSEKDFASILESGLSKEVLKWLRPAPTQFQIYWDHNSRKYEPDFVLETDKAIYMVEIKKDIDMDSPEVKDKARAALEYCKHATTYNLEHNGKAWKYLLIPHDVVLPNMSFDYFSRKYEKVG
jgi:type III restriction enzyme